MKTSMIILSLFFMSPRYIPRDPLVEIDEMRAVITSQANKINDLEHEINELKNLIK